MQIKAIIVGSHTADSKTVLTGEQQYSDTSPFSIPWTNTLAYAAEEKRFRKNRRQNGRRLHRHIRHFKGDRELDPARLERVRAREPGHPRRRR